MKTNPWKILNTKQIFSNPWIRIQASKVIDPGGKGGEYTVVHFQNVAVAILPLDEDNNTWIVGQYRFPLDRFEWELPEGGSPLGKDLLENAKRELQEETGIQANKWEKILEMQLSNSVTDEISVSYIARELTIGESQPDSNERLYLRKLPFSELYEMVMKGDVRDALTVATVLKARSLIEF
ncbi:MAG: NUDIX hydrolase [Bacteroidia bacterium]|nr:NUDIX hydrolase [Bacteroidia bacterium]